MNTDLFEKVDYRANYEPTRVSYRTGTINDYVMKCWCSTFIVTGNRNAYDNDGIKEMLVNTFESITKDYQGNLELNGKSVEIEYAYDFINGWWEITVMGNIPLF